MISRSIAALWLSTALLAFGGTALAEGTQSNASNGVPTQQERNARKLVQESAAIVQELRTDTDTRATLKKAKGVFIVPNYGQVAFGVGRSGGAGVLVANNDGQWSGPAFYNIGSISLGLEAGVSSGSVAFLLMNDKALAGFRNKNNFSLDANAGLTVVNWTQRASVGEGADVIAWSDTRGLYGDLAVSGTDISSNTPANHAYYQKTASAHDILDGSVKPPKSASNLESEFSALESGKYSGRPGTQK